MRSDAWSLKLVVLCIACLVLSQKVLGQPDQDPAPSPLLQEGVPVSWWFAFKFNAVNFPRPDSSQPTCLFGGQPGGDKKYSAIGQDYVIASDAHPVLQKGSGFLGDSTDDPVGATFDQVYNGSLFYIVWNDQFYRDPLLKCEGTGVANDCEAQWGHSKGVLAWNEDGDGFVMQVTTPSWPGAGNKAHPRALIPQPGESPDGNSLGCVNDNDVEMSQDFFALKLTKADLLKVLAALQEAGAVTDTTQLQIVNSGGPQEITDAVKKLGSQNMKATFSSDILSSGVRIIAKAGGLSAPPWQMVSAVLGRIPMRVASYWEGKTAINSTTEKTPVSCWPTSLKKLKPGAVQIATTGIWDGTEIGLTGEAPKNDSGNSLGLNHAKIGVSTSVGSSLTIFGDMNQDGVLSAPNAAACMVSQNKRGVIFFVVNNADLHDSVALLLSGDSAPPVSTAVKKRAPAHSKKKTTQPQ
jgi:Deoxyribonuclease II